jgi:hypothetical protein
VFSSAISAICCYFGRGADSVPIHKHRLSKPALPKRDLDMGTAGQFDLDRGGRAEEDRYTSEPARMPGVSKPIP